MKKIILLLLITTTLSATDWKYVGEYDTGIIQNIKCSDNICYACSKRTEGPVVLKSYDYGKSWEVAYFLDAVSKLWWDVKAPEFLDVVDTNYVFLRFRDEESTIMKSTDGGYSFIKIKIDHERNRWIQALRMFTKDYGVASAAARIYITHDGWETIEILRYAGYLAFVQQFFEPQIKDENSVYFLKGNAFYDYNVQTNDTTFYFDLDDLMDEKFPIAGLRDIEIVNDTLGFAIGSRLTGFGDTSSDLMYRTKGTLFDWELQFDSIPVPEHAWGMREISFYDEFNGVAAGKHGRIYLTKDGGNTWIVQSMQKQLEESGDPYNASTALAWADTVPLLGANNGSIFRYEGDFFDFSQTPRLYHPTTSEPVCGDSFDFPPASVTWNASDDVQYYRIELDDNYKYKTPLFIADSLTDLSVDLPPLPSGREYFWRVRGYNEELVSRWSDNCTFSIKEYKPTLIHPVKDSLVDTNYVEFEWESSADASGIYEELYYKIQVSKSETFDTIAFEIENIEDYTIDISEFDWSTTYFWRVKGYNDQLANNWSEVFTFHTGTTGIYDPESTFNFTISPNPAKDYITIKAESLNTEVELYNMLGFMVLKVRINEKIDVSMLPRGIYLIMTGKNHLNTKVLLLY